MKILNIIALLLTILLLSISVSHASLVGATTQGCLGPLNFSGCTGGPTFDFFFGQTKTIIDPGIEFTNTQSVGADGSVIRSANFTGNSLTITIDGTNLTGISAWTDLIWSFTDFSFIDDNEVISGLSLIEDDGLGVLSFVHGPDTIQIGTENIPSGVLSGEILSASFSIDTTVVPIPATFWLFGSALGLMSWRIRKS